MSKVRILTVLVVALALINVGLVAFSFLKKPPHPPRQNPKEVVIEQLHFSAEQAEAYELLIAKHRGQVAAIEQDINATKQKLFLLLPQGGATPEAEALFAEIAAGHVRIEQIHFAHFLDIKKLCTPDQLPDFENLTQELGSLFSIQRPPKNKNH